MDEKLVGEYIRLKLQRKEFLKARQIEKAKKIFSKMQDEKFTSEIKEGSAYV